MKNLVCYARGAFLPESEASVSVNDLGLQRGYGIFDFMRISKNIPLFIDDHLERFFNSAFEMRLTVKETKQEIRDIVFSLIKENNQSSSGIRLLLTGGESPDGYKIIDPGLIIIQQPLTPPPDELQFNGYRLLTFPYQRQLSQIKTTDYLMAIWLQPWLKKQGGDDILYHHDGFVSECPRSNFFIVSKDDSLITPVHNMLKGITRKQVIILAKAMGMVVEERDLPLEEIREAREVFITSSTKRIIPVSQLDDRLFPVKSLNSVTTKLWKSFLAHEMSFA